MKIEDNFLDQNTFDGLQTLMIGKGEVKEKFAWYYSDGIDFKYESSDPLDYFNYMFVHVFYFRAFACSPLFGNMEPLLVKISPMSLWRIKANLLTRTPNIIKNTFHVDILDLPEEKLKQWTTSIFYINTNNGYTEFEDGTKVESIANRMVFFPSNVKHRGTSCTDEKTRVVINFNYFSRHFCE